MEVLKTHLPSFISSGNAAGLQYRWQCVSVSLFCSEVENIHRFSGVFKVVIAYHMLVGIKLAIVVEYKELRC